MSRVWTRLPWQPRRLLGLAFPLAIIWLASLVVGHPSKEQSLICAVGGPCAVTYAKDAFAALGAVAGTFALILVAVAAVRWVRDRAIRTAGFVPHNLSPMMTFWRQKRAAAGKGDNWLTRPLIRFNFKGLYPPLSEPGDDAERPQ